MKAKDKNESIFQDAIYSQFRENNDFNPNLEYNDGFESCVAILKDYIMKEKFTCFTDIGARSRIAMNLKPSIALGYLSTSYIQKVIDEQRKKSIAGENKDDIPLREKREKILKDAIFCTYDKYQRMDRSGLSQCNTALERYIKENFPHAFTNSYEGEKDENGPKFKREQRTILVKNVSSLGVLGFIVRSYLKDVIQEKKKEHEEIFKNSLYSTYEKYEKHERSGLEQCLIALKKYIVENDAAAFTRDKGARHNILDNVSSSEAMEFLIKPYLEKVINRKERATGKDKNGIGSVQGIERRLIESINRTFNRFNDDESDLHKNAGFAECMKVLKKYIEENDQDRVEAVVEILTKSYVDDLIQEKTKEAKARAREEAEARAKETRAREEAKAREEAEARAREEKANAEKSKSDNDKIVNGLDPKYKITNLRVNDLLVNQCREDVLRGKQQIIQNDLIGTGKRPRIEYSMNNGELTAVTDIGNSKKRQEDSVLILYHPSNPNYKFLMVADGMGGHQSGDEVSKEIARQMVTWFETLPVEYMETRNLELLRKSWADQLNKIHKETYSKYINIGRWAPGSTFVGAIVGEEFTQIASVGDSRCYILDNDNELQQITVDDNENYYMWNMKWENIKKDNGGIIPENLKQQMEEEKDNLRFRRDSNKITECIGGGILRPPKIGFYQKENDKYKVLFIASDGPTDLVPDKRLKVITKDTDRGKLAEMIANEASSVDSTKNSLRNKEEFTTRIEAGKDNITIAVLDKRTPKKDEMEGR